MKKVVDQIEPELEQLVRPSARDQAKKMLVSFSLWNTKILLRLKRKQQARQLLVWILKQQEKPTKQTLSLVSRAWNGQTSNKQITDLRAEHLKNLIERPIKQKNYARLLYIMARYEALDRNTPVAAGDIIARQMVSEIGREKLRIASAKALKQMPNSPFLLYINSATSSKVGGYVEASRTLSDKITAVSKREATTQIENRFAKKQFDSLCNSWRVVDLIARESMGWLDAERGATYAQIASKDIQARLGATTHSWVLDFKEPMLQGRDERGYLEMCQTEFNAGETLIIKLKLIKEMVREGARRQLSYHTAYDMANQSFDEIQPTLRRLLETSNIEEITEKAATSIVQTLVLVLDVCRALGKDEDLEKFKRTLLSFAKIEAFFNSRWLMLPVLIMENIDVWGPITQTIHKAIRAFPPTEKEVKAYFQWAMHMRDFEGAEAVFKKLKGAQRASPAVLYYVNILQRQSRFTEAINIIKAVNAYMLAKPSQLNPFQHWSLIRRYGELYFLRETANLYVKIKQPRRPKGIIIVAARNVDQIRKYPLVVLMELKRRGWAIIPLVEGLLPREMTGNKKVDALHGCMTIELEIRPEVKHLFPPVEDFVSDPSRGILRWGKFDFSHSMMEDARINRRAFDIDLTCPSLDYDLRRLSEWTEHFARATVYAHKTVWASGIRCGLMSLFNSRMPDSLFRPYCDAFGDSRDFFCLQTANGYENYFTNFSTSISTRCVVRNMTEHSDARSSSLPVPALFDQFFEANKSNVSDVLERVEHVATMRRTTGDAKAPDPQAIECEKRIMEWRQKGGKVACLFGRVVCDSAVPFDGGPAHKDIKDWLNHSIDAVRGTNTLLLIKPHPHELNEQIATYLNEYFTDLIKTELPENVIILGHRWFDIQSLKRFVDLGLIFSGTTAVELALLELPAVVCGHFGPIDYPVGHIIPKSRRHYESILAFKSRSKAATDMRPRAAMWLEYMSNERFTVPYRYHSRPITNKTVYPPYWIKDDVTAYLKYGDRNIEILASRTVGTLAEPRA